MAHVGEQQVTLDGASLTIEQLVGVARNVQMQVTCDSGALEKVHKSREHIESIVKNYIEAYEDNCESGKPVKQVYGVTTGFGEFKTIPIAPAQLEQLQRNILLSHAAGVGVNSDADDLANYFPAEVVRATLVIRLNTLLKGYSGVQPALLEFMVNCLHAGVIALVPMKGSVGSSGDLCPMAHMFATLLGEGRFYVVKSTSNRKPSYTDFKPASELPQALGVKKLPLPGYKDGLALTNGATVSAAMLGLAVHDAMNVASIADAAAAMTLEAICGRTRAFDPKVHHARGQRGQIDCAANILSMVSGSRLANRCEEVQDAYSIRCAPAVHGASRDTMAYARMVAQREMNAACDNPLFFPGDSPCDAPDDPSKRDPAMDWEAYSVGNFHGQPIALAADFLAIALAELANISERRTQMLLDRHHNRNLPANLVPAPGVNSGFMLTQYCAASLVSENKVLTHPASVDSIPTSANTEDHNSMATIAARKLRTVLANTQAVLAIELLVAAQAIEWRAGCHMKPSVKAVSADADAKGAEQGEYGVTSAKSFAKATSEENRGEIASQLGVGTRSAYLCIRKLVSPVIEDRTLDEDIRLLRQAIEQGSMTHAIDKVLPNGIGLITPLQPQ